MAQNNRNLELAIDNLALMLEALEEYIRRANHYSDWTSKEQFFRRTIPSDNKSKNYFVERAENHFFSALFCFYCSTNRELETPRKAAQKEFYKWVDHSGITAENCPEKLKHYLNEINEILENRGNKFYQARKKELYKNPDFKLKLNNPLHYQAYLEVNKSFGYDGPNDRSISEPKIYAVKIEGNAEQGQQTFSRIKNSIASIHEWTFLLDEEYYRQLKAKIKELEGKKDQPQPKEEWKWEANLDSFDDCLMTLELYIQKLNYYPNWKISAWTEKEREDWRKNWENKTAEEIKGLVQVDLRGASLMLRYFKADDPNYYPVLLDELKTKFSQWQKERKIDPHNYPDQLKQIFFEINQVLEGKKNQEKNDNKQEKIAKIIVEIKLEMAELTSTRKHKINLGSQFDNWESKLINIKDLSEAKSYQQRVFQKIQAEKMKQKISPTPATSENKFSLPAKIALGVGIMGIIFGTIVIFYRVIKNKKVKK